MRSKVGPWVLYAVTLPWTLTVGYGWVLLACLVWAAEWDSLRFQGRAVLTAQWREWVADRFDFSTTFGRGVVYHPRHTDGDKHIDMTYERHEHVHVRQVEDLMLLSLILGAVMALLTGVWWHGLAVWWSGGAWQIPNFWGAWLRGGHAYRDSEHERSAYAQTDIRLYNGKSWLEKRTERVREGRLR